jgi:hypothetical protein
MDYTITKRKRYIIISCSSFLILHVLITRILLLIDTPTKIDNSEQLVKNIIYLILLGYLLLEFYNYFRHYKLKVLQVSILIIFIMEIILRSTFFSNLFESIWQKAILLSASTIWIAFTVVLIVVLFKNKSEVHPGMLSIRNYAISSLLIYVFATTYRFYLNPVNPINTLLLVGSTSAIPFIFTIIYGVKLNLKN